MLKFQIMLKFKINDSHLLASFSLSSSSILKSLSLSSSTVPCPFSLAFSAVCEGRSRLLYCLDKAERSLSLKLVPPCRRMVYWIKLYFHRKVKAFVIDYYCACILLHFSQWRMPQLDQVLGDKTLRTALQGTSTTTAAILWSAVNIFPSKKDKCFNKTNAVDR